MVFCYSVGLLSGIPIMACLFKIHGSSYEWYFGMSVHMTEPDERPKTG